MACVLLLAANPDLTVFSEARPGATSYVYRKIKKIYINYELASSFWFVMCEDPIMTDCGTNVRNALFSLAYIYFFI